MTEPGNDEREYPFACCSHCGCGTPGGVWEVRRGHDDTCQRGCNDAADSVRAAAEGWGA